jgi:DNA-directed RNA polymerase subunit RPC12/RpoP
MSDSNNPPKFTGPGSPQDVPPLPGELGFDPYNLPTPIRKEILKPDPVALDTNAKELKDGLNQCPKCGSTDIRQKPGTDLLVCAFCRNEWQGQRVEEQFGLGEGQDQLEGTIVASGARDIAADEAVLRTYKCQGCGAEVTINTESEMTARCHWCRSVFGVNEQVANGAVPDAVLPFHLKKDDAVTRIREFVDKRRFFALKAFKEEFTPENVIPVYLPYMVVDAKASADVAGKGEIETRRYTRGEGNNKKTYYDADVYQLERHVDFTVDDLTLESSRERGNFDTSVNTNNVINTILPFDTKNAVKWNASYLRGCSSEKRDLNVEELKPRLADRLLSIARAKIEGSANRYNRGVRWEQEGIDVHGTRWVAMSLPVWLYSYQQASNGLLHYIAVNGRTGETMGSVPIQQWKLILTALTVGTFLEGIVVWILAH